MSVTEVPSFTITSITSLSQQRVERGLPGSGGVPECEAPPVRFTVSPAGCDGVAGIEIGDSEVRERQGQAGYEEVSRGVGWTSSNVEELHSEQAGVVLPPPSSQENIEQI